jgi:glycerol-3-phosphate acyltransferase PlsX
VTEPVTVAVDANGCDHGPREVAAAAARAAALGTRVLLFGPAAEIVDPGAGVELVDAPVSIAKAAEPVAAVRSSPDASIVQAARAVAEGRAQALVSGGSTGAAVAAGVLHLRRARGVHRPALAVPLPSPAGATLLLDVGANVEARAAHLVQFAFLGAAFARSVMGVARPRVALLSNGTEADRGTPLTLEAAGTLRQRGAELDFLGNLEATQLTVGAADVVVTDGFTGNVALKAMEGASQTVIGAVREAATGSLRGRAGGLLLRGALGSFRQRIDPERTGGAYLLGLTRLAVLPHGRFGRAGYAEAIALAERSVRERVGERTYAALEAAGALRRAASEPASSVGAPS